MEQNKQALSLYEDRVSSALHTRVPTLTDEQHGKVAQLIIDMLMEKRSSTSDEDAQVYHLVTIPDKQQGGMTAFLREYPQCVSEGEGLADVMTSLANCLFIMIEDQQLDRLSA